MGTTIYHPVDKKNEVITHYKAMGDFGGGNRKPKSNGSYPLSRV